MAAAAADNAALAAGAAALAAMAEQEAMGNERVEAEIPDELKEQPPPESLFALDKRMDELLSDIKVLQQQRAKDYQNTSGRVDRLAAFQSISVFEKYKHMRAERIEEIVKTSVPERAASSSKLIADELDTYWQLDDSLAHDQLLVMLVDFFKHKASLLLEQNALMLSRWARFCRTSHDVANFFPVFQRYQEHLHAEYVDTAERFERLSEAHEAHLQKLREEEARAEADRIEQERRGLLPGRAKPAGTPSGKSRATTKSSGVSNDQDTGKSNGSGASNSDGLGLGHSDLGDDPQFDIGDLVVFLRWAITHGVGRKHVQIFLQRAKMFVHSDRIQFIKDYRMICNTKPSQGSLNTLNAFEGINNYIENLPVKRSSIEDFLTEFDILVGYWNMETPIFREDGRPFAYEADSKFREAFAKQSAESSFPPYEGISSSDIDGPAPPGDASRAQPPGPAQTTAPPKSLAAISGIFSHPGYKNANIPRLIHADWLDNLRYFSDPEVWRQGQLDFLGQLIDIDFELRYEHDVLLSNDLEYTVSKLKEAARRIYEMGTSSQGGNPGNSGFNRANSDQMGHDRANESDSSAVIIASSNMPSKTFELGIKVPDPQDMESAKDYRVLDGKKHAYGVLLRKSAEMEKMEQAVAGDGEFGASNAGRIAGPMVSALFSEHEIMSFLQLRHVRIRNLRNSLLSQFNFYRSVEKRLTMDLHETSARVNADVSDPIRAREQGPDILAASAAATHMWHQQELFDMPDAERGGPGGAPAGASGPAKPILPSEDIRQLWNNQMIIKDQKGTPLMYDAAIEDMKSHEAILLKLATMYINHGRASREGREDDEVFAKDLEAERAYGEAIRLRIAERKSEVLQFIEGRYTFLNPNADRMQMLLELYDHEVKFQFAKIELINAYLEIYEHTSDPKSIKEIGQLITNIVHTRPGYDFESPYFSRAYAMATRTFRIQAQLILDMIKDGVDQHRSWYQKCFGRLDPTLAQNDLDGSQELTVKDEWENAETAKGLRKLDSPISAGLPPKEDGEKQTVTMHHASVILGMTEFVPTLDGIIQIHKIAFSAASEMFGVTEELFRQGRASNLVDSKKKPIAKIDRQAVECAVWKGFHNMWQALYDHSFHIPQPRNRRLIGRIDAELWMENPLMPDIILMDHYQTYGKTDAEPELKHIAARTPFTDPVFKPKAAHICQRLIKLVVLKDRLYYSWRSTENWRRIYEGQFPQLNVNKDAFTGRLNSLKFDFPDVADNTAVEEDYEEETTDGGPDDAQQVAAESDDERDPAVQFGHSYLRFGPLAVAELDEHLASAISLPTPSAPFDLSTVSGINTSLRPEPMRQMAFSLKIQTVEKFWHMAAVELHHLLLSEVHAKLLIEGTPAKIEKAKGWERRSPQRHGETPTTQKTLDVDYRLLITAIVPKKKALRKMMLTEYNKGFRTSGNMTEEERDQVSTTYKYNLYEWYYNNMLEITLEECERAEYAKIMIDFRNTVQKTSYGRLLFRSTKVARHFDYFSNQDKPSGAEAELDPSQLSMDGVATQEIIQTDLVTTEKISKLWFLPSVTEIVMTSNSSEKSPKGPFDLSQRVYRNIGTFRKALSIQSMLLDIFLFVKSYAHLLQDNRRYVVQVRQVREADYVVNTIGAIKKDMSYQGQQADFVRVEQYLAAKWKLWILKLKLALGCSMYTLGMTVKPYAYMRLLSYQENLAKEEIPDSIPLFQQLTTVRRICFTPRITPYPSPHIFGGTGLKTDAKRLCDKKILELEECLDEFLQATMLNFGENADEVNRLQSDFLLTGLKLLALRRKFLAGIVPSGIIHTREQLQEFFRLYKMKVMVPAIRLYHKMGAKGNASIPMLLRDEMVTATVDFDFNRIAQALFDRCQVAVLQTELQREYTFKLIRQTRIFYDRLADERTGRLFRVYDSLDIPSSTANKAFAFRMTEDDYAVKTAMIHDFVKDLWRANSALLKEIQEPEKNMPANKQPKVVSGPNPLLEHGRVFTCTRDMLGQAITKLARQMSKWQEKRRGEQEHFMGTLMGRMMEMAKTGEKLVKHLVQEKKEWMETYKRDVRVSAFQLSSELHTELASTSVELADLRKQRRTDERRIRYRILDEYDDLVQELVMEINVLRNRFSEYRVNTFQEVMSIMSEAKKDELHVLIDNQEMPANMKDSAKWMIRHEEEAQALRQENHELKMTLLKVRSMFIIKEQALRSMYEKKTRKLAEGSKSAEEKLWDSYREAEVRESTLRRQLAKAQKTLSSKEAECDTLQRHLREEQQRVRQLTPITSSKDRAVSAGAGGRRYAAVGGDNDLNKIAELQDRLSRYEALKIDLILNELQEKTKLVEQMVDEKRKKGGVGQTGRAGGMAGDRSSGGHPSDHRRRAVSARLARPPMVIKAIAPRRKGLGPYSEYREWTAEDESLSGPGQKIEKAVNDHMVEKMNNLALQNKILRQVLEQCNIPVPSEAGDFMEESPLKRGTSESRKSVMWVDQQQPSTSDDLNSEDENDDEPDGNGDLPSTPKARPAQSAPPGGRLRAAQLRSKPLGSAASAGDVKRPPRLPRPNSFGLEPGPVVGSEGRLSGARESATPGSSTTSLGPEEMQKSVQPGSTRSIRAASAVSLTGSTVSVRQSSSLLHSRPTSASDYRISDALRTGTPPPLLPQSRTSSARRDSVGSLHASGSEARFSLPSSPRPMTPRI